MDTGQLGILNISNELVRIHFELIELLRHTFHLEMPLLHMCVCVCVGICMCVCMCVNVCVCVCMYVH